MNTFRGAMLKANGDDLELKNDVTICVGEDGRISENPQIEIPYSNIVMMPGTANTHCHIFQPPAIPGDLIQEDENGKLVGWLPETLKFETKVKENPELARRIARAKFDFYIQNGITASLEYTTSSEAAARTVLEVADEMGFGDRIKVGYVAMNQGVDFIEGVALQSSDEEALRATENLLKEYGNRIVVIDRFPIAVTSSLRRKLAELAREFGVLYETHMDESEGEADIHAKSYNGARILETLFEDGVFEDGAKIGLAHAIHTNREEMKIIQERIKNGVEVNIRACSNSNAQLQSHRLSDGTYVPFPLKEWQEIGANVSLGLDKGAGRGVNIFAEALYERGRIHTDGVVPSYVDLLKMATVNGIRSLGLPSGLEIGEKANFIVVKPAGVGVFYDEMPQNLEQLAGAVIEGGQDSRNIQDVFVNGRKLK